MSVRCCCLPFHPFPGKIPFQVIGLPELCPVVMSEKSPLRIFVTHAFQEHEEYLRVFEYLESRDKFFYFNCSNPDPSLATGGEQAVQECLRSQIKSAEAVVFPVGLHAQNPRLIDFELNVAQAYKIPIIAIKSHGGTQSLPRNALLAATETVDWNDRLITDALRRHGRGEDIPKWDVIEFDPD
jgi:MTH538 TIR-like domain (DUF1863)